MAEDAGILDMPEAEPVETPEIEAPLEEAGVEAPAETQEKDSDDPYTTRFSREFRAATKAWEAANPEQAKFARQARDNHARMFALNQLEPKGIEGVREKYALLDGLSVGEVKGAEAVTAMQQQLAAIEETDQLLAQGDPRAFESLGEDFNEGLAKLAPAYLERIQKTNPEAFEAAILPHMVARLASSELVKEYNALVDVLNSQGDPRFDEATKSKFTIQQLAKMGQFLNGLQEKAGQVKTPPVSQGNGKSTFDEERAAFEQERQQLHWDTRIKPVVATHENQKFDELFGPYQKRLRLDEGAKADLQQAFKAKMNQLGAGDIAYMNQMKIYRSQKNPDPNIVANFVKNAINKHSRAAMESLIKARYSPFLNGTPRPTNTVKSPLTKVAGPVAPNIEVRGVKPAENEIDFKRTPIEWLRQKQYRLLNGKVVQVRQVV